MFSRKKIYIFFGLLTLAGLAMLSLAYTGFDKWLNPERIQALVLGYGQVGVVVYVLLVACGSAVGVPRQLFGIAGGYVFGLGPGLLWLSVGLLMGCSLGFFVSRKFFQKSLQRKFGERLQKLEGFLRQNTFLMAVVVRFAPLGNNATTNIIAGLTTIPATPFILGSACGYLPQSLIFTLVGTGVAVDPVLHLGLAGVLLVLALSLAYFLYKTYMHNLPDNPCA